MEVRKPDFTGWATVNNVRCSDGRTIMENAFKHQDKQRVPLVWQHDHQDPSNVLGHAILENRAFGVHASGYFNGTARAKDAHESVRHGDINALSIFANKLKQQGGGVYHGNILEVSLVLSGANPEAMIQNVTIEHSDGRSSQSEHEAIIYSGLTLEHQDNNEGESEVAQETETKSDKTVKDVFESLTEEQKNVVYFMIGEVLENQNNDNDSDDDEDDSAAHSISTEDFLAHINKNIQEGIEEMSRNVFATHGDNKGTAEQSRLSHSQFAEIVKMAEANRADSLKDALAHGAADILQHNNGEAGVDYGISDINYLFPDAKVQSTTPDFISRRMEWVNELLQGVKTIPMARVKTVHADIREPEARAKGYITGNRKKEEVFKLLKRTTSPTTVYKKQRLDRDDELDITDFDVVVWMQQEIRLMLEEEVARAILVGDNRAFDDEDKIKDPEGAYQGEGIRSIRNDSDLYTITRTVPANTTPKQMIKEIVRAKVSFRGTGKGVLFIDDALLTELMLEEDRFERRLYETEQALADALRVEKIVPVELFSEYEDLVGIIFNLRDYSVGTNKGGEITRFEDFDIDFNQRVFLSETRLSGGLTVPFGAIVILRAEGTEVRTVAPTFSDNTITIPSVEGLTYRIDGDDVTGSVTIEETTDVTAHADEGYYIATGSTRQWTFTYTP